MSSKVLQTISSRLALFPTLPESAPLVQNRIARSKLDLPRSFSLNCYVGSAQADLKDFSNRYREAIVFSSLARDYSNLE